MTEVGRITAIIDGDISALGGKLSQARTMATQSASGIESAFKSSFSGGMSGMAANLQNSLKGGMGGIASGLSRSLSGGDLSKAGAGVGNAIVSSLSSSLGPVGNIAGEAATALGPTGIIALGAVAGAAVVGTAAIAIGSHASAAAREWESGMSQISKTTGIAKGSTGFEELSGQLKDLTSTMPTTVSEIQGVASSAGSLGIAQQYIAGFTETALKMGSAFDIPAEQAGVSLGRIMGQTKAFPAEVQNSLGQVDASAFAQHFGSAVDFVGNSLNATEADVLDFSTRVSGSLSGLNANAYEVAGWGGVMSSVFPSAQLAAGSFDSALTRLTTDSDAQAAAAGLLGISVEEYQSRISNAPTDTLLDLGEAIEKLPSDQLMGVAKALGGNYGMDTFTKMVGHTDEWRKNIDDTVEAGKKGESIGDSFAAGADTVDAQMQILSNSVQMILTDMGGPINSAIAPIISSISGSFNSLRTIGENLWGPFTTAISPATTAVSLLASGIGALAGFQLDVVVGASEAIGEGFKVSSAVVSAFGEELENLITGTDTFKALSGAVEDFEDSISGIGDKIGEIGSKISTGLATAIPTALSGAGNAVGTLLDKAGLGGVADLAGDVNTFFGNVIDNAKGKLSTATEEGMAKGADAAAPEVTEAVKESVEDGFLKAVKDSGVSSQLSSIMFGAGGVANTALHWDDIGKKYIRSAMTDLDALAIFNSQSKPSTQSLTSEEQFMSFMDKFTISKVWDKGGETGKITITDSSGQVVTVGGKPLSSSYLQGGNAVEYQGTYDRAVKELKEKVKSTVTDMPKYLRGAGDEMSSALETILSDGVVDFTERDQLGDYIASLDQLQLDYPIEFQADKGIQKIRDELKAAKLGADVDLTGKLETNFSLWLSQNAEEYSTINQKTGAVPLEQDEKALHQMLTDSSDRVQELYGYIDTAATSGNWQDVEVLPEVIRELGKIKPEILGLTSTQNRLATAQATYGEQVKRTGDSLYVVDSEGKKVANAHLRTSQAADILDGGLIGLSQGLYNAGRISDTVFNESYNAEKLNAGKLSLRNSIGGLGTSDISEGIMKSVSDEEIARVVRPLIQPRLYMEQSEVTRKETALSDTMDSLEKSLSDQEPTYDEAFQKSIDANTNAAKSLQSLIEQFDIFSGKLQTFKFPSQITPDQIGTTGVVYSGATYTPNYSNQLTQPGKFSWDNLINSPLGYGIPKFAEGAKVTTPTLAFVGEAGTEYVIPESDIKGLYAKGIATARKGSIDWIMNDQWFEYLQPKITMPTSYRWSSYPAAPQVQESNTDAIQTAWLSDQQKSAKDVYSGQIRAAQLAAIGKSQVIPWFARGEIAQPDWWVDEATRLSPKYASNWAANKGGTVPRIAPEQQSAVTSAGEERANTIKDSWDFLYGEAFTEGCIGTAAPDRSLKFTPSASLLAEQARTWGEGTNAAWNQLYGDSFTEGCIGTNKPDSLLKFTPSASLLAETTRSQGGAWGSEAISVGGVAADKGVASDISAIKDYTRDTADISKGLLERSGSVGNVISGSSTKRVSIDSAPAGALVAGKSKEGYVVKYDPRTDTCEGLAFNPPDPSLKTTDRFYLGITAGNLPAESYDEGYGWGGRVGWTDDLQLQAEQKAALESLKKDSQETSKDVKDINKNTASMTAYTTGGAMVAGIYTAVAAGSGALNSSGSFGGSYGSLFGGWYSGGAAGLSAYLGTGSATGWMNSAARSIGGSGAIQWAKGGLASSPEYFLDGGQLAVRGEAGPELILPLSDRRRTAELLQRYLPGVKKYARGGLVGGSFRLNASEAVAKVAQTVIYSPTINGSGLSQKEIEALLEKDHQKFMKELDKKDKLAKNRRT